MGSRLLFLLLFTVSLTACGDDDGPADAASDAPGLTDSRPDMGPGDGGRALEEAVATALQAAARAIGPATSMSAPLVDGAETLRDAPRDRDTMTQDVIQAGVSGDSIVTPESCATFMWSGSTVTITFTGCSFELTGESVDGVLTLSVAFNPTTFSADFDSLQVGDTTLEGQLTLNVGGTCTVGETECMSCRDTDPMCAMLRRPQKTISGTLSVTQTTAPGESTSIELVDLHLVLDDMGGASLSGTLRANGMELSATDLRFAPGDCLPSSGSVTVLSPPATVMFLETTPSTGIVSVRVGAFPPTEQMLFMACGT